LKQYSIEIFHAAAARAQRSLNEPGAKTGGIAAPGTLVVVQTLVLPILCTAIDRARARQRHVFKIVDEIGAIAFLRRAEG
jgi:hypothetical protein